MEYHLPMSAPRSRLHAPAPRVLALVLAVWGCASSAAAPASAPDAGDAAAADGAVAGADAAGPADLALGDLGDDGALTSGWQTLPDLPVARMEVGVAALRGQIFVVGGTVGPSVTTWTTAVHAFDPASNGWRERRSLPGAGLSHANVAVVGDRLFVLGPNANGQVLSYDPESDSWTEGKMAVRQYTDRGAAAVGVIGGKIYVAGGGFGSRIFAVYDPGADSWESLPALGAGRDHVAGAAMGDKLYVIGGSDRFNNVATDRVEVYDVTTGTWAEKKPMPTARSGCAAVVIGGEIVVAGGEGSPGSGVVSPVVEAYDPASDGWRTLPPMRTARHGIGAAVVDGKIYVPGGSTAMDLGPGGQTFEVLQTP
jgi:N-acetylneuraminic acid mutarotase